MGSLPIMELLCEREICICWVKLSTYSRTITSQHPQYLPSSAVVPMSSSNWTDWSSYLTQNHNLKITWRILPNTVFVCTILSPTYLWILVILVSSKNTNRGMNFLYRTLLQSKSSQIEHPHTTKPYHPHTKVEASITDESKRICICLVVIITGSCFSCKEK